MKKREFEKLTLAIGHLYQENTDEDTDGFNKGMDILVRTHKEAKNNFKGKGINPQEEKEK